MTDSTQFIEVYNTTGEVLQNVSPDTVSMIATILTLGFLVSFGMYKKYNFSISK